MLFTEAGCVFMGLILYISGVQGRANRLCALKGSSVDLSCSAEHPTSRHKWFTVHSDGSKYVQNEIPADGHRVSYNMSEESNFTLTIKDVTESDANFYCCSDTTDNPKLCWQDRTEFHVTDLQVKVIPATEGQTVTLMCNTSCPLTGNPAVYIWYKNGEFLYQDSSPWYQQLVSSEKTVRYSCAVKDYEDLRAPEVSVDSVTSTCFTVTYAKGRMCSHKQTSEDEPCSITYPTEIHVQKTANYYVTLTCKTSCPLADPQTAYRWYWNRQLYNLLKIGDAEDAEEVIEAAGRVEYHVNRNHHMLTLYNLMKNDSAEYTFRLQIDGEQWKTSNLPKVTLVVTGLKVTMTPSAEVTEGQRATLTCSTSCPLTDNTSYIWYLNSQPLTRPENQNKQLVLDPVSSQDAGNYSCGVKTPQNISSPKETLTVKPPDKSAMIVNAVKVTFLLLILPVVFLLYLTMRKKKTLTSDAELKDTVQTGGVDSLYESIALVAMNPAAQQEDTV